MRENIFFPVPVCAIWSDETGLAVPSRVSPHILHSQAEHGAYYHRIYADFADNKNDPFYYTKVCWTQEKSEQIRMDI